MAQQGNKVATETGFVIDWFYVAQACTCWVFASCYFDLPKILLLFKFKKNDISKQLRSYLLILRSEVTVPHSFWNRIFCF
jgi:hypothetical protein